MKKTKGLLYENNLGGKGIKEEHSKNRLWNHFQKLII
jgi:hypothetical protein